MAYVYVNRHASVNHLLLSGDEILHNDHLVHVPLDEFVFDLVDV